jgi:putative sterol carrier protein
MGTAVAILIYINTKKRSFGALKNKETTMATVAELFEKMPGQFQADKAGDMNAVILFDLSGEGGGQWSVKIADGACDITQGAADSPKATVRMDAGDYHDMITGKLNPMMAFMSGKVKVEGDLNSVMKFQQLFGM